MLVRPKLCTEYFTNSDYEFTMCQKTAFKEVMTNYTDCCVQIHNGNFRLVDNNVCILVVVVTILNLLSGDHLYICKSNFSHVSSTTVSEL